MIHVLFIFNLPLFLSANRDRELSVTWFVPIRTAHVWYAIVTITDRVGGVHAFETLSTCDYEVGNWLTRWQNEDIYIIFQTGTFFLFSILQWFTNFAFTWTILTLSNTFTCTNRHSSEVDRLGGVRWGRSQVRIPWMDDFPQTFFF